MTAVQAERRASTSSTSSAPTHPPNRRRRRATPAGIGRWVLLALVLAWTLVPIAWMVLSSLKTTADIGARTPKFVFAPTLSHYSGLFTGANDITGYLWHSVFAALVSTAIAVSLGATAGYGLARSSMRGKKHLAFWIISTRMAPIAAVILPLFLVFRGLHLLDSLWGLVLAYLSFNLPFAIWIMNAFFADLPPSLEEAAAIEGASRWQTFYKVVLPLTKPGLVTTGVLCLVFSWNDYAFAQTFSGPHSQTIPIAASQLVTQTGIDWGQLTAIGTIVVAPMMLAGLAVRRWLVSGLTLGAVSAE